MQRLSSAFFRDGVLTRVDFENCHMTARLRPLTFERSARLFREAGVDPDVVAAFTDRYKAAQETGARISLADMARSLEEHLKMVRAQLDWCFLGWTEWVFDDGLKLVESDLFPLDKAKDGLVESGGAAGVISAAQDLVKVQEGNSASSSVGTGSTDEPGPTTSPSADKLVSQ